MEFIAEAGEAPWCLHLSYIKPHWPCVAPAPYHAMYGPEHVIPAQRSDAERHDPHPIYASFMRERVSRAFARDEVRETVIPTYMGLIKQIDDQMGELFAFLAAQGRMEDTLIVFTSDHGDYLGDHWLGEKELFHDMSVRVPLIVVDPSSAADAARGSVCDRLVEAIDLLPTFIEAVGAPVPGHRVDGRSLVPLLRGTTPARWREFVVSEYDFSLRLARTDHDVPVRDSRLVMLADERWTYVDAKGFAPILFDRVSDPHEFVDLGRDPAHAPVCAMMRARLLDWANTARQRTTVADAALVARSGGESKSGYLIGYWDESEAAG
jgi:arylsulfatase A-like enzyme